MIALEQVRQHLETLGLKQAVEVLDNTLDAAASKQLPYPEMLAELLGVEVAARRERYLTTRTRLAHLPFQRTFEQFDFAFQPSIDERLVKELANLAFVAQGAGRGRIRHLALRPGVGHRLLYPGVRPLRTGQHHSHFQQGLRRMGRTAGRQRDRLGGAGPPAAPQPRTEHPRRKLPAQGETPGGAIPVATPHQRSVGGGRRQLRALTKYQVVQF